jgi:hypothetical protein
LRLPLRPGSGPGARAAFALGAVLLIAGLCAAVSCAHHGPSPPFDPTRTASLPDSVTVCLWRFDEIAGVRCYDSGPYRLDLTAGNGTRISYGRIGNAREFTRVIDSFAVTPYNPMFDNSAELTIDAWVYPHAFGQYELTPIAARWTEEGNTQSWMFAIVGANLQPPLARLASPGYHNVLVLNGREGQVMFAFQPADASRPRAFFSGQRLVPERWTHVAASFDGSVVRFFIDGALDAQYATPGRIQASRAPLLVGNYFDTRRLSAFSGELRLETGDDNPYYAFEGMIDNLRISSTARTAFPGITR